MNFIDWETFHFLRPLWLLSALALAPILWLAWRQQGSARAWERVCDTRLLRHLLVGREGRARRWPLGVLALGWLATSAALAGPAWRRLPQPAFDDPTSTVIVLDLSPSMNTRDVSPSRLARARFKAHDALVRQEGGQVGLVVFAEDPYPVMPLTDDPGVVTETIPLLKTDLMPGHGARLAEGIDEARELLEQAGVPAGRILVLSDGPGDDPAGSRRAAAAALDDGYPVSAIGIGPDSAALSEIADAGGGHFAELSADDSDLDVALPGHGSDGFSLASAEVSDARFDEWEDMGVWLALVPLLLGSLAFRRGWSGGAPAFVFLGMLGGSGQGSFQPSEWFQRADQRGQTAFEEGRHEEAAQLFENPRWRAASLYRAGEYEEAARLLQDLPDTASRYNLGNALARQNKLEEAIAAYDEVLAQDPAHEDARFNRDLLKKLLEQQKQEQQKQDQQQDQQNQSQDGQQDQQDQNQQGQQGEQDQEDQQGQQDEEGQQDQQGQEGQQDQQGQQDQGQEDQQGQQDQGQEDQQGQQDQGQQDQGQDQGQQDQQGQQGQAAQGQQDHDGQQAAAQPSAADEEAGSEPSPSDSEVRPEADYDEVAGPGERSEDEPAGEPGSVAPDGEPSEEAPTGRVSDGTRPETTEQDQAIEQWLGRIPDDPAGLLREKIRRRYVERRLERQ